MNSRTELYAVLLQTTITLTDGKLHSCSPDMYELCRNDKDAIRTAENHAKYLLTVTNVYGDEGSGNRYTYESTEDGRYDAEGNEIEQQNWKRVTGGNCEWDIAYTITLKENGGTRQVLVCKWVDFEF